MLLTELQKLKKGKVRLAELKQKVQDWIDDFNAGRFTNNQFPQAKHMAVKGIHPKTRLRTIYSELEKHFAYELLTKTDDFSAFGISPMPTLENIEATECEAAIAEIEVELDHRISVLSGEKTPEKVDKVEEPEKEAPKNYSKMKKDELIARIEELESK